MAKYIPRGSKAFKIIKRINDVYTVKCPSKGRNLRSKIYQLKFTRPLKTMFDEFAAIAQQLMVHYEPMPIIDQLCVLFRISGDNCSGKDEGTQNPESGMLALKNKFILARKIGT